MDLSVDLISDQKRGLYLANPVMTASGTFGNGLEYQKLIDIQSLGAIVSKAITLRPRPGNVQPRIAETPAGMINSIGLQNIGIEAIRRDVAPIWATWRVPVIANIAGDAESDYAELARRLDGVPGVSGIEMNISCPNVETGLQFGSDPRAAAEVTAAVRRMTDLPLLVKLTPDTADIVQVARAVADSGADAVTVINTYPAMRIDIERRRPALGWGSGGLSGPALLPIALRMVYLVSLSVDIPIVGCGGITSGEDAIEMIMAGASAVQVGTATFRDPHAPLEVLSGIKKFLRNAGAASPADIVGSALSPRTERVDDHPGDEGTDPGHTPEG
jgi:dihydroorotate dehydrogenase (NAD+) catalytic subunit